MGMQPSEFWNMKPRHFWALAKREDNKSDRLSGSDIARMKAKIRDANKAE